MERLSKLGHRLPQAKLNGESEKEAVGLANAVIVLSGSKHGARRSLAASVVKDTASANFNSVKSREFSLPESKQLVSNIKTDS